MLANAELSKDREATKELCGQAETWETSYRFTQGREGMNRWMQIKAVPWPLRRKPRRPGRGEELEGGVRCGSNRLPVDDLPDRLSEGRE